MLMVNGLRHDREIETPFQQRFDGPHRALHRNCNIHLWMLHPEHLNQ
jgi:hypothetical protein